MAAAKMRPEPIEIRIGGRSWTIRPFSLAQLEIIEPVVVTGAEAGNIAYGTAVLQAALTRDYPEDAARVAEIEGKSRELADATRAILVLAGYMETAPGEADAAQGAAASTSTISTDASAPRRDGPQPPSET